jgi:hypothetical protein
MEKMATSSVVILCLAVAGTFGLALHARSVQRDLERQLAIARARAAAAPVAMPLTEPIVEAEPAMPVPPPAAASEDQQRRILELEERIRAKDDVILALRQAATNSAPAPESFWRGRQEWLEQLKTNNPAEYEAAIKERDESRRRVREAYARKAAHFLEHDTSTMTETEVTHYNLMLKLLDDAWKISDQLRAENLPREQRRELVGAIHDTMEQLGPLLENERNRELNILARELGYQEDEAAVFVSYVTNIIDATSMQGVIPRGPGGRWWGGGGSTNR